MFSLATYFLNPQSTAGNLWSASSYRNFINRNDCICLLNIPVTTSSTKDLESWNDQTGLSSETVLCLSSWHIWDLSQGIPWWFYHHTNSWKESCFIYEHQIKWDTEALVFFLVIGKEGKAWIFLQVFIYISCLLDVQTLQTNNQLSIQTHRKLKGNSANVDSFKK